MYFESKVSYPNVLIKALKALKCSLDLKGCYEAFKMLNVEKVLQIKIVEGEFCGCFDNNRINEEIFSNIVSKYPELFPIIEDFRDEGSDYSGLCSMLSEFIEDVCQLSGNRTLILDDIIPDFMPVKKFLKGELLCGTLCRNNSGYILTHNFMETKFQTAFDVALDGWAVD